MSQIETYGRIAVCNHTDKVIPESMILSESALRDERFFDNNKHLIPVFNACLGQCEDVTKVLLADLGSGFIPRGEHDSYQKGTFILGPGGRGKSEFQKIVRIIHGSWNCITPCQNTLGKNFRIASMQAVWRLLICLMKFIRNAVCHSRCCTTSLTRHRFAASLNLSSSLKRCLFSFTSAGLRTPFSRITSSRKRFFGEVRSSTSTSSRSPSSL